MCERYYDVTMIIARAYRFLLDLSKQKVLGSLTILNCLPFSIVNNKQQCDKIYGYMNLVCHVITSCEARRAAQNIRSSTNQVN